MRKFSELGIVNNCQPFTGEKIKMAKILNKEIVIHNFRIEDSKYPKNKSGKCLYLQIELDQVKYVVFTGSDVLINTIKEVQPDQLPFSSTIIQEGECYLFS